MELNPNNAAVTQANGQWHKLLALVMVKLGLTEITVTVNDVEKLTKGNVTIVLDARSESNTSELTISLVDDKTAKELARQEGGRPIDC